MEMLVAKCSACQASFKFGKDKAGRKAKCPKCGKEVALPKGEDSAPAAGTQEDDGGGYAVSFVDEDAERQKRLEAEAAKVTQKKPKARIRVRRKNIGDLDAWAKVNTGLVFFMSGACVWGAAYGLHALVIFLGLIQGPQYGPAAERFLHPPDAVPLPGVAPPLDRASFFLAMLSGTDFFGTSRALMIISQILMVVVTALWMTGYGLCLAVENRMGTRGQLITLFVLSTINLLLNIFLWLLPMTGVLRYVLMPAFAPEVAMAEANTERVIPVHVAFGAMPMLEVILTLVVNVVQLLEPIMIGIFIWTMASMVRDEPTENKAMGLIQMGFGVLFLILAYHMYAVAGSSSVLVKLLRAIYLLWFGFQIGMIVRLATTCYTARDLMKFYLNPVD